MNYDKLQLLIKLCIPVLEWHPLVVQIRYNKITIIDHPMLNTFCDNYLFLVFNLILLENNL